MTDSESPLARRLKGNVTRAAVAHAVVAWLFLQIADVVLPYVGIVDQPVRWALLVSVGTFPVTLFIAWLFVQPRSVGRIAIAELVALAGIAALAAWWVHGNLPELARERTSLVILPLQSLSGEADSGLANALAQEVGSLLMRSNAIDVISFESASSPVLQGLGTVAVANRLNVGAVLSGVVATRGENMRVELSLLSAAGEALWEAVIDDRISNLFALQEQIASEIEARLGAGDDVAPIAEVAAQRCWMPGDADSLRRYYTARHYIEARTDTDASRQQIAEAIAIYKSLLEQHPEFAEARAGLAWAYEYQFTYDRNNAIDRVHEVAARTAAEALEDCATLGEAMHLAELPDEHENLWIREWQTLSTVIELEPHKPDNYQRLARHYREAGLRDRAREVAERLVELNPLSIRSLKELASIYMDYEMFEESKALYRRSQDLGNTGPNWAIATEKMTLCRRRNDMECVLDNLHEVHKPYTDQLRVVYRTPDTDAEAEESIAVGVRIFTEDPHIFTNWLNVSACEWNHLTPLFFEVWEGSRELGSYWFWPNVWIDECDDVWTDARFPAFVEETGLVEYWREVGWLEACQPQGESFACGRNIQAE